MLSDRKARLELHLFIQQRTAHGLNSQLKNSLK
jgi:hypothetical protein